jgi:hypothetical protein
MFYLGTVETLGAWPTFCINLIKSASVPANALFPGDPYNNILYFYSTYTQRKCTVFDSKSI